MTSGSEPAPNGPFLNELGGPQVTVLPAADRLDEPWRNGGGSTRQVAAEIGPDGLAWRLSMARVDADGPFSVFPGITRTIMVIEGGEMLLNVAGTEVRLGSEPVTFDGEASTSGTLCGSAVTDFNVMVRRGQYSAGTERIAAGQSIFRTPADHPGRPRTIIVMAPTSGARLEIEELGVDLALSAHDAVMVDRVTTPLRCRMTSSGVGVAVVLTPEGDAGGPLDETRFTPPSP